MKLLKITLVAMTLAIFFIACSKSNDDNSTVPVPANLEGEWVGKLVTDADKSTTFYSFYLWPNGSLDRLDENNKSIGTGTWTVDNNIFTATYKTSTNNKFSVIGSYNKSLGKILGNWGYDNSVTNGGTWEMALK